MAVLWKKESNCADAVFVDLFANINNSFSDWNMEIQAGDWKNYFLAQPIEAVKNNKVSDSFRIDGGKCIKRGQWLEAMELYTQSLRFAEVGTGNICIAYARRSLCFLNMQEYEKCLVDIELAIKANYPQPLMAMLKERKLECEKRMQEQVRLLTPSSPTLSFTADEKFPCMANALEIRHNEEFGRHIVAKCDIPVGKTILVEDCFVSSTFEHDRARCFTCLQVGMNFIVCSNCTDALFCSEDCHIKSEIHQNYCGSAIHRIPHSVSYIAKSVLISLNAFSSLNEMMNLVEYVLLNRNVRLPETTNNPRSNYAFFLSLKPASHDKWDIENVYQAFTALMSIPLIENTFSTNQSQRFLMHLVGEHSMIILNNSSATDSLEMTSCILSLFNHACSPNVQNYCCANKDVCITIRPIKKGQQLFTNYFGDDTDNRTTSERQNQLHNKWNFICKCNKCSSNDELIV